jgi:hypothetical protein
MIQFFERIPARVYDIAFYAAIIAIVLVMAYLSPSVHAAPLAKQQEPGCVQFTKVGMWDVYECVDSKGHAFIANSAGMLVSVGN